MVRSGTIVRNGRCGDCAAPQIAMRWRQLLEREGVGRSTPYRLCEQLIPAIVEKP